MLDQIWSNENNTISILKFITQYKHGIKRLIFKFNVSVLIRFIQNCFCMKFVLVFFFTYLLLEKTGVSTQID